MTVNSMSVTDCKEFYIEWKLGLDDDHVLIDFLLFSCGSCFSFSHEMNFVCFV